MRSTFPSDIAGKTADSNRPHLVILERDPAELRDLAQLVGKRFDVRVTASQEECLRLTRTFSPAAVIVDAAFVNSDIIAKIKEVRATVAVFVAAEGHDVSLAFRASKAGADDMIVDSDSGPAIEARLLAATSAQRVRSAPSSTGRPDFSMLFGTSPKMEDIKMTIDKVAETNATVLIRGESGTGKEMVARMVYQSSARADKPFVKVNCAAIPYELLESELFGYEQGAFTGANRQKPGKFDQADGGTLFLDEISEMHPSLQAKLLHVLQDGEFARLGGKRDVSVDVRVLAATNKPLERDVADGKFREDLFYRLNVVSIHIPPLRERREEIPIFLEYFLARYSDYYNKRPAPFSDIAIQRMMDYSWPGNIRELENLVKRYTIVGNELQILRELSTHKPIVSSKSAEPESPTVKSLALAGGSAAAELELAEQPSLLEIGRRAAMKAEREAIERTLLQTKWNRRQAAKLLKVSYKALLNKLKAYEEDGKGIS
jgi:two-component system, NtrC family, response regulator AtoC